MLRGFEFEHPWFLLMILLAVPAYFWAQRTPGIMSFSSFRALPGHRPPWPLGHQAWCEPQPGCTPPGPPGASRPAVSAPLPTTRGRPPGLAHVARRGNAGRYGSVGERSGWIGTPYLPRGARYHAWDTRARLWHDLHISWQPVGRCRSRRPPAWGRAEYAASATRLRTAPSR